MDNNMTAIVSVIMIALGFANGVIITSMIDKAYSARLEKLLYKAIDQKFQADLEIDELKQALEDEKKSKAELVSQVRMVIRSHEPSLPPPKSLERSTCVCDSDSDCEDEFVCPTSPDAK